MNSLLLLLTVFLISGGLLMLLSIPLILQKVPPNPWYGFRVRRTLQDPTVWYPVNAYGAWYLLGVGTAIIVTASVGYFTTEWDVARYAITVGIVALIGVIAMCVQTLRYVRKLPAKNP